MVISASGRSYGSGVHGHFHDHLVTLNDRHANLLFTGRNRKHPYHAGKRLQVSDPGRDHRQTNEHIKKGKYSNIMNSPAPNLPLSSDEKLMGAVAHFFGPLVALIIWSTQKEKSHFVKFQALQALAIDIFLVVVMGILFFCSFRRSGPCGILGSILSGPFSHIMLPLYVSFNIYLHFPTFVVNHGSTPDGLGLYIEWPRLSISCTWQMVAKILERVAISLLAKRSRTECQRRPTHRVLRKAACSALRVEALRAVRWRDESTLVDFHELRQDFSPPPIQMGSGEGF
jgi:uncharacterized Tic20 family protein